MLLSYIYVQPILPTVNEKRSSAQNLKCARGGVSGSRLVKQGYGISAQKYRRTETKLKLKKKSTFPPHIRDSSLQYDCSQTRTTNEIAFSYVAHCVYNAVCYFFRLLPPRRCNDVKQNTNHRDELHFPTKRQLHLFVQRLAPRKREHRGAISFRRHDFFKALRRVLLLKRRSAIDQSSEWRCR